MNLLHSVVSAFIENYPAITGALSACFHFGVVLSCLTAIAGIASAVRFLLRRAPHRQQ